MLTIYLLATIKQGAIEVKSPPPLGEGYDEEDKN
jgi:hypothetical protein